ncbi:MAG: AAA family ATPase [Nitrospirae bacterium]|nr:AAA family ATPase [Nitrospirota bacterium]MCL5423158.1 AAA family ATPase [Nitrospirota bacterium]
MYKEYFGLKELPFSIAPDPRYLYMSHKHREALAHLLYGINSDGGFVLLTGEVGTGKTTVCRCLLEQLPENTDVAFVLNPKLSVEELLATLCDELGIRYPEIYTSVKVFVDRINACLLDAHARGRRTVLIIEEAQNLSADVLEQLRLLTNLETNERKLLQIILVGQPELQNQLANPEMRQLAQRITARYHLGALSRKEVAEYVSHRLAVAGVHTRLFPPATMDKLFRLSGGIPRLINVICDRALLGAYVQGQYRVDKSTLTKAAREVFGESEVQGHPRTKIRWALAGLMLMISAVALAATFYNNRLQTVPLPPETLTALPKGSAVPEPPKLDTLQWPSDQPVHLSREMAYQELFRQWDIPYTTKKNLTPCQEAKASGLGCLDTPSGLSRLLQLNRPAVLKLFDDQGKEFYATLTALEGQTATFVLGNKTKKVDVKEIEGHWMGDYTLLWRTPPKYQGDINPGIKGTEVQWLEKQLALINGQKIQQRKNPVFDNALVFQVKKFQLSKGLKPDGVVGPQTIIHLNTAAGSDEPLLSGKKKEK